MATGSDLLLEHLLFQVALSGDQGFSITALSEAFVEFNKNNTDSTEQGDDDNQDDGDLLFSLKPPGASVHADTQASDPQHLEKLWTWLVDHPDVTLKQITKRGDEQTSSAPDLSNPLTPVFTAHADQRLFTTEHRIWQALTDHDVDWKRIPKLEFHCLMIVGAAGRQGVLQPDVTRLTGQDKRSVPKRTDALASKGYITKEMCLGGGIKTSLLRLKKLTGEEPKTTYVTVKGEAGKGENGTRRMVNYEQWFSEVVANLKKHNGIIAYEDLRKEMGIHGLRWETRALHRCMKRLEKAGCVQRLRARLEGARPKVPRKTNIVNNDDTRHKVDPDAPTDGPGDLAGEINLDNVYWVRCIKLMREPVEKDKEFFISTINLRKSEKHTADHMESDAEADADEDEDYVEIDSAALDGLGKMNEITKRIPPQWHPGLHHTQFHFQSIKSSGTKGLTTIEMAEQGLGSFWRRPLDEVLARLSDVWTSSQPLHLRHLAVVRDTSQMHRISHYVFRSFDNFQKLVESGDASWEAIGISASELAKKPELDAWGFPKVKPSRMAGSEGIANIVTCRNTIKKSKAKTPISLRRAFAPTPWMEKTNAERGLPQETPTLHRIYTQPVASVEVDAEEEEEEASMPAQQRPKKKQYKQLFKMNPKRVEAELDAWKDRVHKLAVSRAKQELGLNIKQDAPRPKKRRRTTKTAESVASPVSQTPDAKSDGHAVVSDQTPPAVASFTAVNVSQSSDGSPTVDALSSNVQPTAQVSAVQPAQSQTQPEKEVSSEKDATPVLPAQGNPLLDQRVADIVKEVLSMTKPGVYINPPGSGQTKNDIVQARGRPSRYLIGVFKSEKLKSLPWFKEGSTGGPRPSMSPSVTPEPRFAIPDPVTPSSAFVTAKDGASPAEHVNEITNETAMTPGSPIQDPVNSEEPKEEIIIKKGRRLQVQKQGKRKAYEPLRQKVTKKLAVESSINAGVWTPVSQLEKAYGQSHIPSKSPPSTPLVRAVAMHRSPSPTSSQPSLDTTTTDAVSTSQVEDPPTVNASVELSDDVLLDAQRIIDIAESERQASVGASESDVTMDDAVSVDGTEEQQSQPRTESEQVETNEHQSTPFIKTQQTPTVDLPNKPHTESDRHVSTSQRLLEPFLRRASNRPNAIAPEKSAERLASPGDSVNTPARSSRAKAANKVGVGRSGGIVSYNRVRVLLEIIRLNGGVFGGERELYYPFVTVWDREYQRRPDRHTLDRVLASMLEEGKLKKITFGFTASNGQPVTRAIIMEPHIDPESQVVQDLKQKIIDVHPMSYVPESTDVLPELRLRMEHDSRIKGPNIHTFFQRDPEASVSRIQGPQKVHLGMTEARMQKGVSARRRRREEEERRQQRYMQAQMEEEIDEAVAALSTEIQLDSYQHDPTRAVIDRGPRGRGRLAKLQRWGAQDHNIPKRALGLLVQNGVDEETLAEQNSRDALAASDFGVLRGHGRVSPQQLPPPPPIQQTPRVRFEMPERGPSLAQILQDKQANTFSVIEALSMTAPYQRFHRQSGTFSTDPVVITTSNQSTQHGFHGHQMQIPRSLADIFRQAGEEATLLGQPDQAPHVGYEVPRFAAVGVTRLPRLHSARTRPPPRPLPDYKTYGQKAIMPRAARTGIFSMSDREEQRLVYAVVIVKTLTGGLEQIVNWGLVHQVFHYKFDANYCRHRWVFLRPKLGGIADKLQVEFQKLFLEAYERGEVPGIDFMEPEKYDWLGVVEWAESRLSRANPLSGLPDLPRNREALDKRYEIKNATDVYNVPREDFWTSNVTHLRREELANSWTFARPLVNEAIPPVHGQELMLALSWVRANVVTPDAVYDGNKAHNKLIKIEQQLPRALDHLLGAKVIRMENKGRQIPGRNYDISDQVLTMFKRQWDVRFLKAAAAFKNTIDQAFAQDGKMSISYQASDPEMTAMTNLISSGRAKVVPILPETNHAFGAPFPRLTKWGFTEGNYKTVNMDKSRLHFALKLHPTNTYQHGIPITKPPPPLSKQFPGEIGKRLPLWTDINGDLIQVYWDMTLMATLWLLAFRPGLRVGDMAKGAYKGKLWTWELEMFLGWAEEAQLAKRIRKDGDAGVVDMEEDGWMVDEWWWLAFA